MDRSHVLLINTNITRPPVSPVGLEYIGETLVDAGIPVRVLDLAFETDWKAALAGELRDSESLVVGLSVRNIDDSSFVTKKSFLPWISEITSEVKRLTSALVLLGGVGFSIMPEAILKFTRADAGIAGDGEEVVIALVRCLINGDDISHLPNMVFRTKDKIISNSRRNVDLRHLPLPRRGLFDNKRYEETGAMVGIETKRGCPQRCVFCADPVAKGKAVRLRAADMVVQELQDLHARGVSWFHLCDSEFNLPITHAKDVCRAMIGAGLGDKLRWYCYCSPAPFDGELAALMKRAGCAGINFGVDSLCGEQLLRLGRDHSVSDIEQLVRIVGKEGLNYIFDLLLGGPGETEDTVKRTIEKVKEIDIPLAGVAIGLRVYPGTPLEQAIGDNSDKEGLHPQTADPCDPVFYLSSHLDSDVLALISQLVAGDPRFLVLSSPAEQGSYNYADDEALCHLIRQGARGAYWDIISRSRFAEQR